VLLEGGALVSDLKWNDRFVAWSWKAEVRIYDMSEMLTISRVQFDGLKGEKCLTNRCNLFWKDPYTIYIGWANEVQICTVKKKIDSIKIEPDKSNFYVQIVSMFKTDFWICGISSFGQYLTVLCLDKTEDESSSESIVTVPVPVSDSSSEPNGNTAAAARVERTKSVGQRPKLHIIQPDRLGYELVYTHILQTRGYQEYKPVDYHLESLTDELLFFVVTPKDIVVAKSRDMDDHIQFLVEHE
jgi:hypothetical protein